MPGGNQMGPRGQGPSTGRGRFNCAPNANAARPYYGRGFGAGLGRGYSFGYNQNITNQTVLEDEKKALEERIKYIDSVLEK